MSRSKKRDCGHNKVHHGADLPNGGCPERIQEIRTCTFVLQKPTERIKSDSESLNIATAKFELAGLLHWAVPFSEAKSERTRTAQLANRENRAQQPPSSPRSAVSGSGSPDPNRQKPAESRVFLRPSLGMRGKSPQLKTGWRSKRDSNFHYWFAETRRANPEPN